MAQTRRKRKHRGTPAGTIERRGRTSKPAERSGPVKKAAAKGRADAKLTSAQRREQRLNTPPTWRGAFNRAAFTALILVVFVAIIQKDLAQGVVLGLFALLLYIPMSYYVDKALYNRRQRSRQRTGR